MNGHPQPLRVSDGVCRQRRSPFPQGASAARNPSESPMEFAGSASGGITQRASSPRNPSESPMEFAGPRGRQPLRCPRDNPQPLRVSDGVCRLGDLVHQASFRPTRNPSESPMEFAGADAVRRYPGTLNTAFRERVRSARVPSPSCAKHGGCLSFLRNDLGFARPSRDFVNHFGSRESRSRGQAGLEPTDLRRAWLHAYQMRPGA